jgi:hypothetical protein
MPAVGSYQNTSALFKALVPQQSFAQLAAQKDRDLYYAQVQEENARIAQQQNAANIQSNLDFQNSILNQPLEAPDRQRVKQWFATKQKDLYKHISDRFAGEEDKFFKAENLMWMKNTLNDLVSSDLYNTALRNKENVALAKKALTDNEELIGRFGEDGAYTYAQQDLLDFMNGTKPTYTFNGSYKPNSQDVISYFGKQDNPYGSKYDRNAFVPGQDVQNYLVGSLGDRAGQDFYYRSFRNRPVAYKRYSLEDQQLAALDIANKQSSIEARRQSAAQGWARLNLQREKLNKELEKDQAREGALAQTLSTPVGSTEFIPFQGNRNQQIKTIGKPISSILTENGLSESARQYQQLGVPIAGSGFQFQEISGGELGKLHNRFVGLRRKGRISEALLPNGNAIDLSKIDHKVEDVDPGIFIDQNEYNRATETSRNSGRTSYPDHEFRKTTISLSAQDALSNNIDITSARKEINPDNQEDVTYYLDVLVPSKGFFKSREIQQLYNKQLFGQKEANTINSAVPASSDEWGSDLDD